MKKVALAEMSWDQVKDLLAKTDVVLVPVGSLEQHGLHLPLETDTILASEVARRAAVKAEVALAPTIPFGFSVEHMNFPGTISLSPETLMRVIEDVSRSLIHHGFKKIFFINGHGGNVGVLTAAIQSLKGEFEAVFGLINIWELAMSEFQELRESEPGKMGHADEFETSLLLRVDASKVRIDEMKIEQRSKFSTALSLDPFILTDKVRVAWRAEEFSRTGVIGDPSKATWEKGEKLLNSIVENLVKFLNDVKNIAP
ncbi:MAG: creatininase family protein [Candidatus Nezhaarchaeota archaeon]|nr:creatininase family protein [Candidatus Nezhaarchaeota archaeon]